MPIWIERDKFPEGTPEPTDLQCSDCEKFLPVKNFKPINTFGADGIKYRSRGKVCKDCRDLTSKKDPKTLEADRIKESIRGEISSVLVSIDDIISQIESLKHQVDSLKDRLK